MREIIDTTQEIDGEAPLSPSEAEHPDVAPDASQASLSKRKKKKKVKACTSHETSHPTVDHTAAASPASSASPPGIPLLQALQRLRFIDAIEGRSSATRREKGLYEEHKFWATQPVPQPGAQPPTEDGYIEPTKAIKDVRQEPYPLPKDFEWSTLDLNDPMQLKEVYDLLSLNYVEDDEAVFRFRYRAEFLQWALQPPGYVKEWHIGVRVSSNKKLVAFVSGVPMTVRVRQNVIRTAQINYLCIHKKLRSKRLTPVLIKEVTRKVNLCGIAQAIYTMGIILPTPVSTCLYYHRLVNVSKLVDIKFYYVPRSMTLARLIRVNKIGTKTTLPGLREMEEKDVPEVADLFARYMRRFDMTPLMTIDEVRHCFLGGRGDLDQPSENNRRPGQVVWTYVVENPETHRVTDFFSFYSLPSTVIDHPRYDTLDACYLFYYASDVAFAPGGDTEARLTQRLRQLMGDVLIVVSCAKFDVVNALSLMDNMKFMDDLQFSEGDGWLSYYLYNWRTAELAGSTCIGDVEAGRGIGVVMV